MTTELATTPLEIRLTKDGRTYRIEDSIQCEKLLEQRWGPTGNSMQFTIFGKPGRVERFYMDADQDDPNTHPVQYIARIYPTQSPTSGQIVLNRSQGLHGPANESIVYAIKKAYEFWLFLTESSTPGTGG